MKKITSQEIKEFVATPCFDENIVLSRAPSFPKISIVTPSYNQGAFLEKTILSILNQNYPNLEYIVIDGGSTDGSVEVIRKYQKYFTYWVSEPDEGQADAIQKGFKKSTGEILAWLNSDDMYLPGTLSAVAGIFRSDSTIDLVYGNGYYVNVEDRILGDARFTPFHFPTLLYSGTMMQAASFWRRVAYLRVGGINKIYQFCMDYDFLLRIAKSGKAKHFRQYLSCFRIHDLQKTNTIAHIGKKEHDLICKNFLNDHPTKTLRYKNVWRYYCLVRRALLYLRQGDSDYFLKGIYRRLTGQSFQKP
jgi:glycosyltransferase involved in cell wall biosynthesis